MQVTVNGEERIFGADATLADVVASLDVDSSAGGVAVARNREIVPRGDWDDQHITDGDHIEVLRAVHGGAGDNAVPTRRRPRGRRRGREDR